MNSDNNNSTNWLTLGLCFVATIFEGLDLQSMGVAAPGLIQEYGLSSAEMGLAASASSVGLFLGALIGGVVSDYIGRKKVMVASVISFGVLSLVTPLAWDAHSLMAVRFGTGLGMGGALPMIIAIAAEAVKPQHRAGAVTMMYCATPIGGFLATLVALSFSDWRYIFYVGGIGPLLFAPVLIRYLKESEVFLNAKKAMGNNESASKESASKGVSGALFGEGRAIPTSLIWIGFLFSVGTLYLLLNWLPLLLVGKGFTSGQASTVQLVFNAGGSTGAILLGWMITRIQPRLIFGVVCLAIAGALVALATLNQSMFAAIAAGFVVGVFVNGFVFLLYGQAGSFYPTACRGTGVGSAVALGRMGAIFGPILAGFLLSANKTASEVMIYIIPLVLIAGVAVQLLFFWPQSSEET